eukprot:TRINITY_DN10795_c0_g1_i1.p1 TRINITY_DN10795_c0_g1~~TRINITY_DN10795_c0_g1_i1.p1  ORF type:complete len:815 (+),score=201.55 TRINITY_DN10795_c0_g1_i1:97-2445(+)
MPSFENGICEQDYVLCEKLKFEVFHDFVEHSLLGGIGYLLLYSGLFSLLSSLLVVCGYPLAAGSGLPEIKGYLNGNPIPGLFGTARNWLRAVGSVLADAGGFVMGREGPMVCTGGSFGHWVLAMLEAPYFRSWAQQDLEDGRRSAVVVDEQQFARDRRIGCITGSAAALAASFSSTLGGLLYMFEECTAISWPNEVTLRTFVACLLAVVVNYSIALLFPHNRMNIFETSSDEVEMMLVEHWGYEDMPWFVVLGCLGGLLSSAYSNGMVLCWTMRNRSRFCGCRQRFRCGRVMEAVVWSLLTTGVFAVLPLAFGDCKPLCKTLLASNSTLRHVGASDYNSECSEMMDFFNKHTVQYNCEAGEYNGLATLLLQPSEGSMKHLYDEYFSGLQEFTEFQLCVALVAQLVMGIGVAGLPVPFGSFVPSMFMGAILGRLFRKSLHSIGLLGELRGQGAYALCGSAATLAGFTHMSVAIVAMLTESEDNLSVIVPMMVCVATGLYVSKLFNRHDFCERLIRLKGVPFLEAEPPTHIRAAAISVGELCGRLQLEALLSPSATLAEVRSALNSQPELLHFPVLNSKAAHLPQEGQIVGLVPRSRLEFALQQQEKRQGELLQDEPEEEDEEEEEEELEQEAASDACSDAGSQCSNDSGPPPSEEFGNLVVVAPTQQSSNTLQQRLAARGGEGIVRVNSAASDDTWCAVDRAESSVLGKIDVTRIADPSALCVTSNTAVMRVYQLFACCATSALCVTFPKSDSATSALYSPFGILERRHLAEVNHRPLLDATH